MRTRLIVIALTIAAALGAGSTTAEARGLRIPGYAWQIYRAGDCDWLAPYLDAAGLPVTTFQLISARESGCAEEGVRVARRTDLSTSRFGINFRTRNLRRAWADWCGATDWQQLGASVELDVACAAAAYQRLGLRPWGG